MSVKLVIADKNELIKLGLKTVITKETDIKIIGEASNADELISCVKAETPDVVIIDYTSEGFKIDNIPTILNMSSNIKFVAVTPEQTAQTVVHAIKSGVLSHVKKDCSLNEIVECVEATAKGEKFFCGEVLSTIAKNNIDVEHIDDVDFNCDPISISEREAEIILMISEGYKNGDIAEKLCLSSHTVNTHRKNIMSKLGVKNTAGIVMYAVKAGIVSPNKYLFSSGGV